MTKRICFVLAFAVLVMIFQVSCSKKISASLDGKRNEQIVHDYMLSQYKLKCKTVKKWTGNTDFVAGRQPDVFILKGEGGEAFPFKMVVDENGIQDGYPSAFMGNVVSKNLVHSLQESFPNEVQKIKCNAQVYTQTLTLLPFVDDIETLYDRQIEVKLYIVTTEDRKVQERVIVSAFENLQETFSDFAMVVVILQENDYIRIEDDLDCVVDDPVSITQLGVEPCARFEYYKSREENNLSCVDIAKKIAFFQ